MGDLKDTALFFSCKRTMSEMKSCISGILKKYKKRLFCQAVSPGGGSTQYAYARTARVPFWPISVPQRIWFSSNVPLANFVPLRVGVSRCRPSTGIHFLGDRPPPPGLFLSI